MAKKGKVAKPAVQKKPKTLSDFENEFPEVWKAYTWLRDTCDHYGALDAKTTELIKVAVEVACGRRGGLIAHVHRAKKAGAKREEILQAVLLTLPLVGIPTVLDGFHTTLQALSKEWNFAVY